MAIYQLIIKKTQRKTQKKHPKIKQKNLVLDISNLNQNYFFNHIAKQF